MRDDEDKSRNALKGKLLFSALWLVDMTHTGQNNATRHRLKLVTHEDCDVKSYKSIELHAGLCFSMMVVCFQKVVKLRQNAGCLLIMILGEAVKGDLIYLN